MTWYAKGVPGHAPVFCRNPQTAQPGSGEVIVEVGELPSTPVTIANDGLSITAIPISEEEKWRAVRARRNMLLDQWRWTVALDSPLSNQADWLLYLKALNRLTIDYLTSDAVVWPIIPPLEY